MVFSNLLTFLEWSTIFLGRTYWPDFRTWRTGWRRGDTRTAAWRGSTWGRRSTRWAWSRCSTTRCTASTPGPVSFLCVDESSWCCCCCCCCCCYCRQIMTNMLLFINDWGCFCLIWNDQFSSRRVFYWEGIHSSHFPVTCEWSTYVFYTP